MHYIWKRIKYEIKSAVEVWNTLNFFELPPVYIFEFEELLWIFRHRIDCDLASPEMDFDNPKIPRGPFEHSEGHHVGGSKDNNDLSFRVPSVPNSPSPALTSSQQDSSRQRSNEINGSNSHGKIFKFLSPTYIIHIFQIS